MVFTLLVTLIAQTNTVQAASKVKAPTIKVTLNDDGVPVISWKKVSGATGYRVYRKTSTDKSWVKVTTTPKTKVTDTACEADDGSTVKYAVKSYIKVNGKTTWSEKSKAVSVKLPAKTGYTYTIDGAAYCTYLDNKLIIKDSYNIPSEFVDENTTLQDLKSAGLAYSTYYYYDENYVYEYSGATYYIYVYETSSDGTLNQIGVYDILNFSPNSYDYVSYLSYQDSLNEFYRFQLRFYAGGLESEY